MIHLEHNTDDFKIRFKTVEFDGKVEPLVVTGTNAGTYIIEVIPQGLSNCPDVKFETTSFRAELFRIFQYHILYIFLSKYIIYINVIRYRNTKYIK